MWCLCVICCWHHNAQTVNNESTQGLLSVGVPGTLAGWCHVLEHYGTMPLATVMGPAIRRAEEGFKITGYLSVIINTKLETIRKFPATAAVFLDEDGNVPAEGARTRAGSCTAVPSCCSGRR